MPAAEARYLFVPKNSQRRSVSERFSIIDGGSDVPDATPHFPLVVQLIGCEPTRIFPNDGCSSHRYRQCAPALSADTDFRNPCARPAALPRIVETRTRANEQLDPQIVRRILGRRDSVQHEYVGVAAHSGGLWPGQGVGDRN